MIRLSMIVKNEEHRYLKLALESAKKYISEAVIIDDGSTDNTVALCKEILQGIPYTIIENKQSKFHNEWELRVQQWEESIKNKPDWIIFLDADEIFEDGFAFAVNELVKDEDCDLYSFRLYDFWDDEHYREDSFWCAHTVYRPFLLRYRDGFSYEFQKSSQHCGRMPCNVFNLPNKLSEYRVKHYGWASVEDRVSKYNRYMELDPNGTHGSLAQYMSILDPNPNLKKWIEHDKKEVMQKLRVLIGSSVCQTPKILEKFLESTKAIDTSSFDALFLFIDDNQDEISSKMLRETDMGCDKLVLEAPPREMVYRTDEITHYWDNSLVLRVANLKNKIITYAIKHEFDYLFLIDSDLLIDPGLINHLIAQKKDIISEIFWTMWQPDTIAMPNAWMYDKYDMAHPALSEDERNRQAMEFLVRLRQPGVYEVGGLGASTLISVPALKKGLNFSPISNVSFWGEDRWFCIRAAVLGFSLFIDTHFPATHLYRDSDIDLLEDV